MTCKPSRQFQFKDQSRHDRRRKPALADQIVNIDGRGGQQAKQEVLDVVWRHASQKALTLTGNARTKVLTALLDEVLPAASSPGPCVLIDGRDRPYVEDILKERGVHFKEQYQDDLLLGIKLEADSEVLTNSFAARLAKAKPELTIELNRLLFTEETVGAQQSTTT